MSTGKNISISENHSLVDHISSNTSKSNPLPIWKLIALSMAGFLAILTETMPAGLLVQIGKSLDVSSALVGQLVTLFAVGSVMAAIPLIAITRSWPRKRVLLMALSGLFVMNMLTAVSTNYVLTLIIRLGAGMATGLIWGLVGGYAMRMVPQHLHGRALAIVMVGQPIALSLGVPLGTWLGTILDWRIIFGILSLLALILIIWVLTSIPDYPGQKVHQQRPLHTIFLLPGIRTVLFVLFVWILAHNILYNYIAPFMGYHKIADQLDFGLFIFGISSVVGLWVTGLLIDGRIRKLTLISLAVFALSALFMGIGKEMPILIYIGIAAWGLTFGGGPTLLQTAMATAAGEDTDVAQSMLVTVFNIAIAGGGIVGGMLLVQWGAGSFPWALSLLGLIGLVTVWTSKRHAFKNE
ncbi:MFS transporter [Shimazuella kribbensis]|uniref:MFS transporter n=1 Tax=Shimazuella kribbensis TaxID=139808 RepID=UPI0003F803F2|nr:MFS transporter [Shimazuella kribbensis]